jgi:hypothetical protein
VGLRERTLPFVALVAALCGEACAQSEVGRLLQEAEARIGVLVLLPATGQLPLDSSAISFLPLGSADSRSAAAHLRLYAEEFAKYPQPLLRRVNLEWVAFVKDLKVGGDRRAATYLNAWAVHTMAPSGGMVYDVRQGASDETYLRWTLHHEFFHFVDSAVSTEAERARWLALNPGGFRYTGRDVAYSQRLDHPAPGFVTGYAMSSDWEDRAELFAALFAEHAHPRLRAIAQSDPIVRHKLRRLIRFLQRLDPALDERHFRGRVGVALDE